jgi:hypothetical protein
MAASVSADASIGVFGRHLSPAVLEFARRHNILQYVEEALRQVENSFLPEVTPVAVLDEDFETGEMRVVIEVALSMTADEAVDRYETYIRQWVALTPPDVRHWVSLSLDVRERQ